MAIPLGSRDVRDPTNALPIITIGLIVANFLVFLSHIDVLLQLGGFAWPGRVPAWVFIGVWFLYQLALSVVSIGDVGGGGGVAYSAHVGGFITGLILVRLFSVPERVGRMRDRLEPSVAGP